MEKKSKSKKRKKQNVANPTNRRFGEITLYGLVYDVYNDGRYITSFIAPLYPPYFSYTILSPPVSLGREIESHPGNVQNIMKNILNDYLNDYLKSNEFKTNVLNIMKEEFNFLRTNESKTDPENDSNKEISPGRQLQNYIDAKIEERMKKYEENLSKLLEQKGEGTKPQQTATKPETLELNDVKKQLDELKKRLDDITNLLSPILKQQPQTKENVSASQGSVATPVPQTPQLTPEQLEQLASKYEVSPEVFEKLPKDGLEDYGKKLLLAAQHSADGIIDIEQLLKYERDQNKDPRVYLPLIEVARYSFYLWEPTPDGKGYKSKVPLLPFEEITWREWSRKYIEKYGCYTGPLEKAYRFMATTK